MSDDAQHQASLELRQGALIRERDELPQRISAELARAAELQRQILAARAALDAEHGALRAHHENARVPALLLSARMTMHQTLSGWVQLAAPSALRIRDEARRYLNNIADMRVAGAAARSAQNGDDPRGQLVFQRRAGYAAIHQMLSTGAPAAAVDEFSRRLRADPNAAAPPLLAKDRPKAVSIKELGYVDESDAYEYTGAAGHALKKV